MKWVNLAHPHRVEMGVAGGQGRGGEMAGFGSHSPSPGVRMGVGRRGGEMGEERRGGEGR